MTSISHLIYYLFNMSKRSFYILTWEDVESRSSPSFANIKPPINSCRYQNFRFLIGWDENNDWFDKKKNEANRSTQYYIVFEETEDQEKISGESSFNKVDKQASLN